MSMMKAKPRRRSPFPHLFKPSCEEVEVSAASYCGRRRGPILASFRLSKEAKQKPPPLHPRNHEIWEIGKPSRLQSLWLLFTKEAVYSKWQCPLLLAKHAKVQPHPSASSLRRRTLIPVLQNMKIHSFPPVGGLDQWCGD